MVRRILYKLFGRSKTTVKKTKIENYIDSGFVRIGKRCITSNMNIQIRVTKTNKTFFSVSDDTVVSGNFIFENANGEIFIGKRTFIGGSRFISINKIIIGNDVLISWVVLLWIIMHIR